MSVRRTLPALVLAAAACAVPPALHADDDRGRSRAGDQAQVRDEVRRGQIVRLERLLADAERRFPGRVIDVDFDDDDFEYEIEILMADGRVVELRYDARSGRLIEYEIDDD